MIAATRYVVQMRDGDGDYYWDGAHPWHRSKGAAFLFERRDSAELVIAQWQGRGRQFAILTVEQACEVPA